MIVKMKFLSISGPKNDIDRVCEVYLSKYEMQLENAAAELKTTDNLSLLWKSIHTKSRLRRQNSSAHC